MRGIKGPHFLRRGYFSAIDTLVDTYFALKPLRGRAWAWGGGPVRTTRDECCCVKELSSRMVTYSPLFWLDGLIL